MSDMLVLDAALEQQRLAALHDYQVLYSEPETDFDDIAVLAAQLCRTPVAAISLISGKQQWFKASVGIDDPCEVPREHSFCSHAMHHGEVMQVPDARLDPRFADNPMVTGDPYVRFYAGAPLVTADGKPLGSLCVIDFEPRLLTPAECAGLRTLARHVMAQLELRQYARGLDEANERLRDADRIKDEFLSRVTHELRTPLTSINGYLEVLGDPEVPPAENHQFLDRIRRNSDRLMALVDDMLLAAQAGHTSLVLDRSVIDLAELARNAVTRNRVLADGRGLEIAAETTEPVMVRADLQRIGQALERLVLNAVKFTPRGWITVAATVDGDEAVLEVRDTGVGISPADQERVLAPFRRSADAERNEVQGAGLGLSIVKAIVDAHEGTVTIDSDTGRGAAISIRLPRHDVC
ncbi:GAF domain-containing sensor histidine kinase [Paractinoplanes durhamensis]|uniref:histidine kinase n=1 Tax=Paractinoplanes durhamensis TaxID=113563 RepID=A0ABQ3Z5E6_9ACTN|nr:GAF domain-containing sensor histidine kinase [Actinoplanes durhamensis]GIE05036.1 sensor histidine kinase [Actinoplanes durhamensis]